MNKKPAAVFAGGFFTGGAVSGRKNVYFTSLNYTKFAFCIIRYKISGKDEYTLLCGSGRVFSCYRF